MNSMSYKIIMTFVFHDSSRIRWVKSICQWRCSLASASLPSECVRIVLGGRISKTDINPFHIVTLSCFIDFIKKKGYLVILDIGNHELSDFIHEDMCLTSYWRIENIAHIASPDASRLNLWRIIEGRSDEYEESVHRYFSNKFPDTDFLMLKTCLAELYFNVFDHAKAEGIAFSYIHYDDRKGIIHIAICDFGEGIASTIRKAYPEIDKDEDALRLSLKRGVTSRSHKHNAGFGLDNILSMIKLKESAFRIVSNNAMLLCDVNGIKSYPLSFEMKGTLIYLDLPISGFDKSEINDEYIFF